MRSRFIGNGWSELVAAEDGDEQMFVISRSQADADYIARAELSGAANEVGSALGYPPCCVEAADADLAGARWAHRLLERSGAGPFPYVVNRLATAWGGLCAVGELFPCRLNCSHARELGCASISALTEVGLARLSDMLRIHATQTLWVHELGDVTRVRPVDERAWTMAQFASVC